MVATHPPDVFLNFRRAKRVGRPTSQGVKAFKLQKEPQALGEPRNDTGGPEVFEDRPALQLGRFGSMTVGSSL